ncbi:nuclear transport factor 2 family protein [Noviherbaspirillum pedocola]|uniref:Nuclear transport factor 2 family protein n=1 Tax=Noviherbaspirillum pedocola TaxID=2801341 RepID=A0A934SW09_9BURK|nr:nuclear transport factor 2 family protein [Noviherbaspirillum pedocola]MBK4737610.1 nuclear transport factor 2 family protein [Noviherbaspirillum pedocola]
MQNASAIEHPAAIAQNYVEVWNETDGARRRSLIERVFAPQASYTDPLMQSAGYDALDAMIAAAQAQFAGLRFSVTGRQDAHHDVLRFSWALGVEAAEPIACGTDIAEMTPDGRIARVTGFLDKMPS